MLFCGLCSHRDLHKNKGHKSVLVRKMHPSLPPSVMVAFGHLIPSAFLCVIRHRGLQPELEPFPTREGSLCFPEGPFQTTLITESMAQPALQHLSDPAVSGFTMA